MVAAVHTNFHYSPLHDPSNDVRLLRLYPNKNSDDDYIDTISCDLLHVSLQDDTSYHALSYEWGPLSDSTEIITVNDFPFEVRKNLFDALQRLRHEIQEPLQLWVDAVCINQADPFERNAQVAIMRGIYEQAQRVLVWLGLEDDDTASAISALNMFHAAIEAPKAFLDAQDDEQLAALLFPIARLFRRSYWERIWIVQEFMAAKTVIVHCGKHYIEGKTIQEVQAAFFVNEQNIAMRVGLLAKADMDRLYDPCVALYLGGPWPITMAEKMMKEGRGLFEVLKYLHQQKATDPRDMIYSMANSYRTIVGQKITIDYNVTATQIYTEFSKEEIERTGRLDLFGSIGSQEPLVQGLPSWAVDWSTSEETGLLDNPFGSGADIVPAYLKYHASADIEAEFTFSEQHKVLKIKGLNLGHVDDISTFSFDKADKAKAELSHAFRGWSQLADRTGWDVVDVYEQLAHTILYGYFGVVDPRYRTPYHNLLGPLIALSKEVYPDFSVPQAIENVCKHTLNGNSLEHDIWTQLVISLPMVMMRGRKIFSSSRFSRIGFCPSRAQKGDIVCLPFGCNWPVILRKHDDDSYKIIGPSFVYGFMKGEAVSIMEAGELEAEDFKLR